MNPGSTMRLGNCALVPGQHTVTFANVTLQTNAFIAALGNENYYTQLLFIRTDQGKVTIQNYAPSIFNCNYLMYRNADDNKFYYAFVVQVVYINENVCDVYFEIDPLQTYMFDYTRNACMVIREHTNDDTIGANIMQEPVGTGELKVLDKKSLSHASAPNYALDQYTAFIFSAEEPTGNPVNVGTLDGNFSGGGVYYSPMPRDAEWGNPYSDGLMIWLDQMSDGHQGAITSIILYPILLCSDLGTGADESVEDLFNGRSEYNSRQINFQVIGRPNGSIDGYTPRNNKLFTYPFCFERVQNNRGQYHDYRWEFFGPAPDVGSWGFSLKGTINPAGDVFLCPINYNMHSGILYNWEEKISLGGLMQVAWPYNSFNNWLGQNAASVATNLITGAAMLIPAGRLASTAIRAGTAAAKTGVARAAVTGGSTFGRGEFVRNRLAQTFSTQEGAFALTGAAMGASQVASTTANLIDQTNVPDRMMGSYTNNALTGVGLNTFTFISLGVRAEFAAMIDDYFDQYGYATNVIKKPNETGRASWNYVQTSGACFTGDVPAPYMREINAMYDAGITFWHDLSYVGDYNRDNSIV